MTTVPLTPDLWAALETALEARNQAVIGCDAQGRITCATALAEKLLEIKNVAGVRRITATLQTADGTPLLSLAALAQQTLPIMLRVKGSGGAARMVEVSGAPQALLFILVDSGVITADNELLDVLAHDLRGAMGPPKMYSQMLLSGMLGPVTEKQAAALKKIDRAIDKQVDTLNSVLDLVKAQQNRLDLKLEPVNLPEKVLGALQSVEEDAVRAKVRLVPQVPPGALLVDADPGRLARILTALLSHAIRQCQGGGSVGAELRRLASGHARLRLWDTGKGVLGEDAAGLLKSCQAPAREHAAENRTVRIELAAVYDVLSAQHVRLVLAHEPGAGTTCTLWFPLMGAKTPAQETKSAGAPDLTLVAGAGAEMEALRAALAAQGCTVQVFPTGRQALCAARENHYGLVFLSDTLTDVPAERLAQAIRNERAEAPQACCILRHDGAPAPRADPVQGILVLEAGQITGGLAQILTQMRSRICAS